MHAASIAAAILLAQTSPAVRPTSATSPPPASAPPLAGPAPATPPGAGPGTPQTVPGAQVPGSGASVAGPASLPILTLRQAIELGRVQSLDILQVNARLDEARQTTWKAWSGYLPQIGAAGSYTRNNVDILFDLPSGYYVRDLGTPQGPPNDPGQPVSPANPPGSPTNYTLYPSGFERAFLQKVDQLQGQLSVNQAIVAPVLWPAIANAYTAVRIADYGAQQARRDVLFGIAQLYYGVAGLKQLVAVGERQVEVTRAAEKDARVRYEAGSSPKVALLRAEIDRAAAEQDLRRQQAEYRKAKLALATALNRPDDFDVELPPPPQPPTGDLERLALERRPEVKAAAESLSLAEGLRTQNYMRYLPSLGAFFNYRYANATAFSGQATAWNAGLGLTWTLLDGGLREAEIRESSARIRGAEAAKASTDARTLESVGRLRLDLDAAVANLAKARERAELARENARLVEVSYRAGAATYLESTDSIQALRQAEIGQVAEALNVDLATLRLLNAVGAYEEVNQ
jgi:outer membrane protein TolC